MGRHKTPTSGGGSMRLAYGYRCGSHTCTYGYAAIRVPVVEKYSLCTRIGLHTRRLHRVLVFEYTGDDPFGLVTQESRFRHVTLCVIISNLTARPPRRKRIYIRIFQTE